MLSDKQIDFLAAETKRPRSDFINMSRKDAHDVREFCFDIECEEAPAHGPISPRGAMAVSIVDDLLDWLNNHSAKKEA